MKTRAVAKLLSQRGEMDCSRKLVNSPFFVTYKSPSLSFQVATSFMNSLALAGTQLFLFFRLKPRSQVPWLPTEALFLFLHINHLLISLVYQFSRDLVLIVAYTRAVMARTCCDLLFLWKEKPLVYVYYLLHACSSIHTKYKDTKLSVEQSNKTCWQSYTFKCLT